jgi:uncharacterized protein
MKNILIAGGTGLVGTKLSRLLRGQGYNVSHLSRHADPEAEFPTFAWQPDKGTYDQKAFEHVDAVINLAGAGIVDKRWTTARKKVIIESRTLSNTLIAKFLQNEKHNIKAYISASAIGFYADRGTTLMTENDGAGKGFLAESTVAWENAIDEVNKTGIRTVALRIGIVLSTEGGALPEMLKPFLVRTGVYFGNGEQYLSWIHIDDLCRMFQFALEHNNMSGVFNAVAPKPMTNYAFTQAIAEAKGGGYLLLPAPAFTLRIAMGEMADTVLGSTNVSSQKIENQGFTFVHTDALSALQSLL